jgi:small subunit ribosomal protein S9
MADEQPPENAASSAPEEEPAAPQEPAAAASSPEGEQPAAESPAADQPAADQPAAESATAQEPEAAEASPAQEPEAVQPQEPAAPVAESSQPAHEPAAATEEPAAAAEDEEDEDEEPAPREKPAVPGAHLEVDIVPEGVDPLAREKGYEDAYAIDPYAVEEDEGEAQADEEEPEEVLAQPISTAAIDLASGARYRATGKRKSAIARVTLRPGTGTYVVNGRALEEHFPRLTLQRNIRQPLETVGYEDRMDVVARLHGGGISAQAGALRHGVSRALLEADPNLRGELKRRGFLTRDSRAKERKKAGLKKARKRPQFSKR